jgi:hypothetical protein
MGDGMVGTRGLKLPQDAGAAPPWSLAWSELFE